MLISRLLAMVTRETKLEASACIYIPRARVSGCHGSSTPCKPPSPQLAAARRRPDLEDAVRHVNFADGQASVLGLLQQRAAQRACGHASHLGGAVRGGTSFCVPKTSGLVFE